MRDRQAVIYSALDNMTRAELSAAERAAGTDLRLFLAEVELLPDPAARRLACHLWPARERRKLGPGRR